MLSFEIKFNILIINILILNNSYIIHELVNLAIGPTLNGLVVC